MNGTNPSSADAILVHQAAVADPVPAQTMRADCLTGAEIAALRAQRGWSQIDLAFAAGMLPDHLRAIEAGVEPTVAERQALAAALDLDDIASMS